jgi:WhiB family transcriptional regulator, redox-sensing transcriptional regulator
MMPSYSDRASAGWMSRGSCRGEDSELFFPVATSGPALGQISAAKTVCSRCAVRAMCLAFAVATRQAGVWGGTTGEERHALAGPSAFRTNRSPETAGRCTGTDHDR